MFSQSQNSDQILFVYEKNDCIIDNLYYWGLSILNRENQSKEYAGIIESKLQIRLRIDFVFG